VDTNPYQSPEHCYDDSGRPSQRKLVLRLFLQLVAVVCWVPAVTAGVSGAIIIVEAKRTFADRGYLDAAIPICGCIFSAAGMFLLGMGCWRQSRQLAAGGLVLIGALAIMCLILTWIG
jgi:hypothetical protein